MTKSFCDTDSFLEAFKFGFLDLFLEDFHGEIMITDVVYGELQKAKSKLRGEVTFVSKDFHKKFTSLEIVEARQLIYTKKKPVKQFCALNDGERSCILYMLENKTVAVFISDDSDVLRCGLFAQKKYGFKFSPILVFIVETGKYEKFQEKLGEMYQKFYVNNTKIPEEMAIVIEDYAESYLGQAPTDVRD